jgi:hypothetical protein
MRRSVLAALLFGSLASLAGAEERLVLAPAGECAGEERDLALPLLPNLGAKGGANDASTPAHLLLSPLSVASSAGLPGAELPEPPLFGGPGACDNPGSGCLLEKIIDDPDPGTGCGFPGSPCP